MRTPSLRALCGACLLAGWSLPALARDLCLERPGQTTPPCTLESGHVVVETSVTDWSLQQAPGSRTDLTSIAQSALRIGVADHGEVAIGWSPFATARTRDKTTGLIDHASGVGDITLAIKRSFGAADAPHLAVKAYASLPVGGAASGAGDWGAGAQIPVSLPLTSALQLAMTPEVDAAVNGSGSGRHLAYGGAAGLGLKLSDALSVGCDFRLLQDEDPNGSAPKAAAGVSFALQHGENLQYDMGGNLGLNANSPAVELYLGISKRF